MGLDYATKIVEGNGIKVKLQLWDTAGHERFRSLTHQYLSNASVALVLFDVSSTVLNNNCLLEKDSFDEGVAFWIDEVKKFKQNECLIYIVANKVDLKERFNCLVHTS